MNYLVIFYFIFLVVYIIFNIYAILRVKSIRIEGDHTATAIAVYITVIGAIILISLLFMSGLDWSNNLNLK